MKKLLLIAFALFCGAAAVSAQETTFRAAGFENGKSSELKGLTKVFVNAGTDVESRDLIVRIIEKAGLPGLVFVDSREQAEIVLRFGSKDERILEGITTTPVVGTDWTITTVERNNVRSGQGLVFIAGKDRKRPRIVLNFESVQDSAFEKRPQIKFAKAFVKAYKEANGLP